MASSFPIQRNLSNDLLTLLGAARASAAQHELPEIDVDTLYAEISRLAYARAVLGAVFDDGCVRIWEPPAADETLYIRAGDTACVKGMLFSPRATRLLQRADELAQAYACSYVASEHILIALLEDQESALSRALKDEGIDTHAARRAIEDVFGMVSP